MSNVSTLAKPSRTTRAAVSNGSRLHAGEVDGRSVEARRFRDILSEITSDLGGSDTLSEGQRQLSRRAAMLSVRGELMESEAVSTGEMDLAAYGSLTDQLGRVFNRLGLKRTPRPVEVSHVVDHFSRPVDRGSA